MAKKKKKPFGKFWDYLAFSRIVIGKMAQTIIRDYFAANVVKVKKGYAAREKYLAEAAAKRAGWRECKRAASKPDYGNRYSTA